MALNRSLTPILASLTLLMMTHPSSRADWRGARGDATRRAQVTGLEAMNDAQVAWKFFIGGSLAAHNHLLALDASLPEPPLLMVAAGRAEKRRIDDALLWTTKGFSVSRFVGLFDMDGDGDTELVAVGRLASGASAALLIDPADGSLLWHSPEGDVGVLADTVRVADMDGDGAMDLYLADTGSNLPGSIPYGVHLYDFKAGATEGAKVWTLSMSPGRDYFVSLMDAIGDFDGDGTLDIFAQGLKKVYIYSGHDGSMMGASDPIGNTAAGRSEAVVVDLDGDGDDEILTFAPGGWSLSLNAVRVALFDWDPTKKKPVLVWERSAADLENDRIAFHTSSVADVDGDGALEVVVSFNEEGAWKTEILDALTGELEASWAGTPMDSTLDVDGDGIPDILLHDQGSPLQVAQVKGGTLDIVAQGTDLMVLKCLDRQANYRRALSTRACSRTDPESGAVQAVVGAYDAELQVKDIRVVSYQAGELATLHQFDAPESVRIVTFDGLQGHPSADWMVVLSSGRLLQFGADLTPLNYAPQAEQPVLGLRIPSYDPGFGDLSSFPVAIDLDGDGAAEIGAVTSDARGVFADVQEATTAGNTLFELAHPGAKAVITGRGAGGSPRVVIIGSEKIVGLNGAGDVLWQVTAFDLKKKVRRYGDVITVDLDDDGIDEVITQSRDSTNGEHRLLAWSIEDGVERFNTVIDQNNSGMRRLAAGRLKGEEEPVTLLGGQPSALWSFDAQSGEGTLISPLLLGVYEVLVDTDGDGIEEILAVNRESLQLVNAAGEVLWAHETELIKPNLGSVTTCQGDPSYLSALSRGASLWRRNLKDGLVSDQVTLAGGLVFDSAVDAKAAGELPASLANAMTFTTTDGQSGVAIGAQDGFLYALDPCTLTLLYSLDVGAPLREIIAADWDGDGAKELVVTAADGYVYGIDQQELAAPQTVLDIDPPRGILDEDVEDIETFDTLYATWSVVPEADAYELAVYTNEGQPITEGFIAMGDASQGELSDLDLHLGNRYIVAIQAHGVAGVSATTLSNGVTIIDVSDPEVVLSGDASEVQIGGAALKLSYGAEDLTAIELTKLSAQGDDGESNTIFFDETGVHLGKVAGEFSWEPAADWPLGKTVVRFEVEDGAGHKAQATVEVNVLEAAAQTEPDPELGQGDVAGTDVGGPDAGSQGDGAASDAGGPSGSKVDEGCECKSGGGTPNVTLFLLLAFFFILWSMRRRERP